ncbi:hypothetical protein H4219_000828 [Mycoemilia scoparia]|uniref:HCP-like protein n=1 Tax=Mycoemilia scoparia TaxID=417184 RepID=A0A9W8A1Z2_9FUNG|nr:hypothetical protein H4219_000828 [Mycoemilia scoparia]
MNFLKKLNLNSSNDKRLSRASNNLNSEGSSSGFKVNSFTRKPSSLSKVSLSSHENFQGTNGSQHQYSDPSRIVTPANNYQTYASTTGGAANSIHEDPEFDDAASYHSISSDDGGASRPKSLNPYNRNIRALAATESAATERDSYYSITSNMDSDIVRHQFKENSTLVKRDSAMTMPKNFSKPQGRQASTNSRPKPMSIDDVLQAAVKCHDAGELEKATAYFKKAAEAKNPVGMLFYGLSLRHGWGCQANEKVAFSYLQRAGKAITNENKNITTTMGGVTSEELSMALYELGTSYRHGWGVPQCKKTAAYYFEIAANHGDADAQVDLASCYENGEGVKRDMKKAAYYYRLAHSKGHEIFGNSWIFKKKYDDYVPESVTKK